MESIFMRAEEVERVLGISKTEAFGTFETTIRGVD